ncbi:hypothetical protein BH11PLA2_BH11PLA2_25700 [soil metagenome]
MKRIALLLLIGFGTCTLLGDVNGRGFGGGGGRSFGGGGFDRGGGGGFSSFSGADARGGSYSGNRNTSSYSGFDSRGASSSYDHNWNTAGGGSINTSGNRGFAQGPAGGFAAGGNRDTTFTTAGGKTYSADRQGGVASGPMGRTVGGASGSVDGRYGTSNWNSAFAGNRYGAIDHYSSANIAGVSGTHYYSNSYTSLHGAAIRGNYGYYNCFHPAWYTAHPGCWAAAGWAAGAAYNYCNYATVSDYCGLTATAAPDYDYGSTVVINNDQIYMNGNDTGVSTTEYATQATTIADKGQTATAPPSEEWKPLGVYALEQGDEKTSNNIFQLAVNKDGIIRGNYYDGLMDTTTEVYGSVDKAAQRAAWTIGKKKDRVFDAGVYNLTQPQCPCLIHMGTTKDVQMLLVRVDPPKTATK